MASEVEQSKKGFTRRHRHYAVHCRPIQTTPCNRWHSRVLLASKHSGR